MKLFFFVLFLCFASTYAMAQTDSSWFMFTDTSTDLIGYKNSKGKIMIEPKFTHITQQKIFKHIMPVYEKNEGLANGTTNYYLLKNGKKFTFSFVFCKK